MSICPYWLKKPFGWNYPAGLKSGHELKDSILHCQTTYLRLSRVIRGQHSHHLLPLSSAINSHSTYPNDQSSLAHGSLSFGRGAHWREGVGRICADLAVTRCRV